MNELSGNPTFQISGDTISFCLSPVPTTVEVIGSVVIEALYVEPNDVQLLPASYHNIYTEAGHVCNNAKFSIYANDVYIGDINLNNSSLGDAAPYDNQQNTPSPLTGGVWTGLTQARYSRIDINQTQAEQIVASGDSTVIQFSLVALSSSPHANITWLRISRNMGGQLQIVQDVLAQLGQLYSVDVAG